jgi:hypothetical protein
MEEERETRIDEDVEGHAHKGRNVGKEEEKDDVEAHGNLGAPHKGAPNLNAPNLNRGDEDDDDVEAHVHINAPNLNAPHKD